MISDMDLVATPMPMELSMRVNGLKIRSMVQEKRLTLTVRYTKALLSKVEDMESGV